LTQVKTLVRSGSVVRDEHGSTWLGRKTVIPINCGLPKGLGLPIGPDDLKVFDLRNAT